VVNTSNSRQKIKLQTKHNISYFEKKKAKERKKGKNPNKTAKNLKNKSSSPVKSDVKLYSPSG